MKTTVLRSDALLLLTAAIWGFAFTAQRAGMEHIGPFLYTGIRFALGAATLLPVWFLTERRSRRIGGPESPVEKPQVATRKRRRRLLGGGVLAGGILFLGVSFQQVGLQYTTAGKAGFITGLYVILVPILGVLRRHRTGWGTWTGAVLAAVGLYFLSVSAAFRVSSGDLLVAASAVFWAFHVQLIGSLSPTVSAVKLAVIQYLVCSVVSLFIAAVAESGTMQAILAAALPIIYGGICSVGIGYTLQVVAQREAKPAHAAIIMSLEGVFAAVGGFLILHETMSARSLVGCLLMLMGMLISQFAVLRGRRGRKLAP